MNEPESPASDTDIDDAVLLSIKAIPFKRMLADVTNLPGAK
jgi:hypothetical protein